ncbi:capsid cement protein [Mannheimia haemolytica]|uniref:capsid cement protein n=1 Tax=Mannheimia haemolytica TaxID=75985 RepID=UPI000B0A3C8A
MAEDLIAIAVSDAAKNDAVVGLTTGVFSVKAKQADDIKQGAVLYWSETEALYLLSQANATTC